MGVHNRDDNNFESSGKIIIPTRKIYYDITPCWGSGDVIIDIAKMVKTAKIAKIVILGGVFDPPKRGHFGGVFWGYFGGVFWGLKNKN